MEESPRVHAKVNKALFLRVSVAWWSKGACVWHLKTGLQDHVVVVCCSICVATLVCDVVYFWTRQGHYHLFFTGLTTAFMSLLCCLSCAVFVAVSMAGTVVYFFLFPPPPNCVSVQTRWTEVPAHVYFAGGAEERRGSPPVSWLLSA